MAENLTSHRPGLAVTLKLVAVFLFMVMSALVKATSDEVPPGEAVFFRSFFAIPIIVIWLSLRGDLRQGLIAKNPMAHVRRGVLGTSAMGMTFAGLGLLPLPEVTAIGFATPIFTLLLAALLLGERIRLIRISAVLIGLIGVMIMIWPRLGGDAGFQDSATIGAILILMATMARAMVQIHIRKMVETENTAAIVFYFSATASVLSLFSFPFGWIAPDPGTAALLILTGLIGGIAQILVTSSYRYGTASMLAPYDYTSMIFAILIGFVWFSEIPTAPMLIGSVLVISGNILVIWREHQLGLERGRARAVSEPKS